MQRLGIIKIYKIDADDYVESLILNDVKIVS